MCLSEFEFIVSYLHVVWFREFIFQCWNEFWIDLNQELSNLRNSFAEIRFVVFCEFLHVFGPAVNFLELFAWKNESSSCKLWWLESHQSDVEERNLKNVLCKEKHFFIFKNWCDSFVAFQKSISWWSCNSEFKFHQNFFFLFQYLVPCKFVLTDSQ